MEPSSFWNLMLYATESISIDALCGAGPRISLRGTDFSITDRSLCRGVRCLAVCRRAPAMQKIRGTLREMHAPERSDRLRQFHTSRQVRPGPHSNPVYGPTRDKSMLGL